MRAHVHICMHFLTCMYRILKSMHAHIYMQPLTMHIDTCTRVYSCPHNTCTYAHSCTHPHVCTQTCNQHTHKLTFTKCTYKHTTCILAQKLSQVHSYIYKKPQLYYTHQRLVRSWERPTLATHVYIHNAPFGLNSPVPLISYNSSCSRVPSLMALLL